MIEAGLSVLQKKHFCTEERMTSTKFETKPLFSRQQLTALLLPLIAEQALSVTIGLADTLMVSSVGEAAV